MTIVKNELSSFIDECFKGALQSQKEKTSLAGEPVNAFFSNIQINNQSLSLYCEIKGKTGEIYEKYDFKFESVIFPYYYLELLRLALISYYSGVLITNKDKRRYLFVMEYGETNKYYLNRSLKYLFYFKKLLKLNK